MFLLRLVPFGLESDSDRTICLSVITLSALTRNTQGHEPGSGIAFAAFFLIVCDPKQSFSRHTDVFFSSVHIFVERFHSFVVFYKIEGEGEAGV